MKPLHRTSAVTGAALCLAVLFSFGSCGGSQPNPGVTNMQPDTPGALHEGQCLSRGDACSLSVDCCSQWCVNDRCAIRQP